MQVFVEGRRRPGKPPAIRLSLASRTARIVVHVHSPRHPRPVLARDPDDGPVDAGGQVAAVVVVGEEGVKLVSRLTAGSLPHFVWCARQ